MEREERLFWPVCRLAVPAALQAALQASLGMADQLMIARLGSAGVAGVGLAGRFASIFTTVVSAIAAVAGIMMAQQLGARREAEVRRSFGVNLLLGLALATVFTLVSALCPERIARLYTRDGETVRMAAEYLASLSGMYAPAVGVAMLSTLLRCQERAVYPLVAGFAAALLNTALNWMLIFGRLGAPALGVRGAALATVAAQGVNLLMLLVPVCAKKNRASAESVPPSFDRRGYMAMLLPVLVCEGMWSLGENVYGAIYGHLGTTALAAMTLLGPIQSLVTGLLSGFSQAAGVLVGKRLGAREKDAAYCAAVYILRCALTGCVGLSGLLLLLGPVYLRGTGAEADVLRVARQLLVVYALVAPFKVENMVLGGGILRSGGRTRIVMWIDLMGTWLLGVPLGLLAAFALRLPVAPVYAALSLEECARFAVSMAAFRKRTWMEKYTGGHAHSLWAMACVGKGGGHWPPLMIPDPRNRSGFSRCVWPRTGRRPSAGTAPRRRSSPERRSPPR